MANLPLFPSSFFLLFFSLLLLQPPFTTCTSAVYFSKTTFFSDYEKMLTNLKVFIYPPPPQEASQTTTSTFSLLHESLLSSPFITHNPNQATLFFIPFPPISTSALTPHLQYIRATYPYWEASLGADHFFFACQGVGHTSSRTVVELKKNSIHISCFPSPARDFIPHKDVTLPPIFNNTRAPVKRGKTPLLGYWRSVDVQSAVELINGLKNDAEFLIESKPSDEEKHLKRVGKSKFCLFVYDSEEEEMVGLSEALVHGCVPVVITDGPIQDLPLMDVIKWSEIALFVGSKVGSDELKRMLISTCEDGGYERMKKLGATVAHHFTWNESSPQPYDAFYMVMYQLWLRRHTIKYSKWNVESLVST